MAKVHSKEGGPCLPPLEEMEAIVARFRKRTDRAQQAAPSTRELVKKAIRREGAARCPAWLQLFSYDVIVGYGDELADLCCEFPDDVVSVEPYSWMIGYQPRDKKGRIGAVKAFMTDAEWVDEWGTPWRHAAGGVGAHQTDYQLKDWSQLDEYLASKIPNPRAPGRLDDAIPVIKAHKPSKYCIGMPTLAFKGPMIGLRGPENWLMDLYTNERELQRLCGALRDYVIELVKYWGELGADAVFLADDWGTQNSLFISPEMWRRFFKPLYAAIFNAVHQSGMDVIFHSCGNVLEIIGDLIEIGVDVLNPIQPLAMDIREVARRFGGKITFCGALDVQHLLPKGSPQEIKDEIHRTVDTLGSPFGNGLILSPANILGPDIPMANLRALFEACHGR